MVGTERSPSNVCIYREHTKSSWSIAALRKLLRHLGGASATEGRAWEPRHGGGDVGLRLQAADNTQEIMIRRTSTYVNA
jgi:hypothetical protein